MISRFYKRFFEILKFTPFLKLEKFQTFENLDMFCIILKHVIYRIRIYSLFREIFEYRKNMSNNKFFEIFKSFLKSRDLNISRNKLYILNLQITCFKPFPVLRPSFSPTRWKTVKNQNFSFSHKNHYPRVKWATEFENRIYFAMRRSATPL